VRFDYDSSDPPSPLTIVRWFLGFALGSATIALFVVYLKTGHLETRLAAFVGTLWVLWGVFHDLIGTILQPFLGFLGGHLAGGANAGPPLRIDMARETAMLEQLMADPPPVPHREILAGIRLAEIYRTHQRDQAKSDALLARLRAKYPDARELKHDLSAI